MSACIYGVNGEVCWHACKCGFCQVVGIAH